MWYMISAGLLFIGLGLAVHKLRWHWLIAGYNTMPKNKKANVDTDGLGRLIGFYAYGLGVGLTVLAILYRLGAAWAMTPALAIFAIATLYVLIVAQKYDHNIFDQDGKLRKGAWKEFAWKFGVVVFLIVLLTAGAVVFAKPATVLVGDEYIKITGLYGSEYSLEEIRTVELKEDLPTITLRTNGLALGSILRGHFNTKEVGGVTLFVDTNKPPFVYVALDNKVVIFNTSSPDNTREVYMAIQKRLSGQ